MIPIELFKVTTYELKCLAQLCFRTPWIAQNICVSFSLRQMSTERNRDRDNVHYLLSSLSRTAGSF